MKINVILAFNTSIYSLACKITEQKSNTTSYLCKVCFSLEYFKKTSIMVIILAIHINFPSKSVLHLFQRLAETFLLTLLQLSSLLLLIFFIGVFFHLANLNWFCLLIQFLPPPLFPIQIILCPWSFEWSHVNTHPLLLLLC